jgi:hypothetical protein
VLHRDGGNLRALTRSQTDCRLRMVQIYVVMRTHWPKEAALDRSWKLPAASRRLNTDRTVPSLCRENPSGPRDGKMGSGHSLSWRDSGCV